jgi:hypothetical protein
VGGAGGLGGMRPLPSRAIVRAPAFTPTGGSRTRKRAAGSVTGDGHPAGPLGAAIAAASAAAAAAVRARPLPTQAALTAGGSLAMAMVASLDGADAGDQEQVAALRALCDRLRGCTSAAGPTGIAGQPSTGGGGCGPPVPPLHVGHGVAVKGERSSTVAGGMAAEACVASGAMSDTGEAEGDPVLAAQLLRRLLLWPVTAALLAATGAGRLAAALRRHPNEQVCAC